MISCAGLMFELFGVYDLEDPWQLKVLMYRLFLDVRHAGHKLLTLTCKFPSFLGQSSGIFDQFCISLRESFVFCMLYIHFFNLFDINCITEVMHSLCLSGQDIFHC